MVKHEAQIQELLRERDRAKRGMQVWLGATIAWAVALGWVVWGLAGLVSGGSDAVAWGCYFVPLGVLLLGSLSAATRLRRIGTSLVAASAD